MADGLRRQNALKPEALVMHQSREGPNFITHINEFHTKRGAFLGLCVEFLRLLRRKGLILQKKEEQRLLFGYAFT
ncbi:MAG: hypothetical protein PUF80_07645 [Firmicutes bacterium]|nr:hypothetical protein [Bacillota bacterium]